MSTEGDDDPGQYADAAEQAGFSHYLLLSGIRQALINLWSVGLYHLFEQQLLFFLRFQILDSSEEKQSNLITISELKSRLNSLGIRIEEFASWPKVNELRLLANSVKHADGSSAKELRSLRLDIFTKPDLAHGDLSFPINSFSIYAPLAGQDLYVQERHIQDYSAALIDVLHQLADAMERL